MSEFRIKRGVNVNGWLSRRAPQGGSGRKPITRDDFAFIKSEGFDHVRLPFQETELWDDSGARIPDAWRHVDVALDWCEEASLRVVMDMHVLRTHHFNAARKPLFSDPDAPKRFAELWAGLSDVLCGRANEQVAYELMNEPVADDPEDWNRVYPFAYRAVRDREPDRLIVLGGNRWSNVFALKTLRVPEGDPDILITFHFYDPMPITHYRAHFSPTGKAYDGPIRYPGVPIPPEEFDRLSAEAQAVLDRDMRHFDAAVLEQGIMQAVVVRDRTGLPIYCGEFGVICNSPANIRRAWARDVRNIFAKHDIPWCAWQYKAGGKDFSLFEDDGRRTAVCEGLLGGQ